jgi:diaminopimelate epimerase
MEIEFLKMQGCGDDSVVFDCFKQSKPAEQHLPRIARKMLDRKRGIGANNLLVLSAGDSARLSVGGFTSGGKAGSISWNAMRCAARYASDAGVVVEKRFPVETPAGRVRVEIIDSLNVRAEMGAPAGPKGDGEIRERPLESFTRGLLVDGRNITYTPVSITKSYGIVFVPVFDFPLLRTGRLIASHPDFAEETGIGFAQVYNREEIRLRVWEARSESARGHQYGVEDRASCTGAAAAVVAAVVNGFTDREVFVHMGGGDVFIQWEEGDNRLYLTGPAAYVFTGTFYYEEEKL